MRTQVGIVGAGPAGLMLSHLLHLEGIESVVLETHTRQYLEERVRAGVLEQGTVDLLVETGLGDRLRKHGLVHQGIQISFGGRRHPIDFAELTGGRSITIYAQQEVVKDLIKARLNAGGQVHFDVSGVSLHALDTSQPVIRFRKNGDLRELKCDFVAGCDGSHGISRPSIPRDAITVFERIYPFAWLGILAEAPPMSKELIYTYHDRGFALFSMRSPTVTRLYLQCAPDEDIANWSDDENLGRTARPPRHPRRLAAGGRTDPAERRHRDAQPGGRAYAVRSAVSGRRCGPHCSAYRSERNEPRHRRCSRAGAERWPSSTLQDGKTCSTSIRRPVCGAPGKYSASRGG